MTLSKIKEIQQLEKKYIYMYIYNLSLVLLNIFNMFKISVRPFMYLIILLKIKILYRVNNNLFLIGLDKNVSRTFYIYK